MNDLLIHTRGLSNWRDRLASPDKHWRRQYSAFETAVSWEYAAKYSSLGIPEGVAAVFPQDWLGDQPLLLAIAEHTVAFKGSGHDSQCDVWALLECKNAQTISMAVEAKAKESFGKHNLETWLEAGKTPDAKENRKNRWNDIRNYLPDSSLYGTVRYQLLHRCAAAVKDAIRFRCSTAALVVQAFNSPDSSFRQFELFCRAIGVECRRNEIGGKLRIEKCNIDLFIAWADCLCASDKMIARVVG